MGIGATDDGNNKKVRTVHSIDVFGHAGVATERRTKIKIVLCKSFVNSL